MKTLLALLVISAIFLSGCSVFYLTYFVLPDDVDFISLIQELDTPRKTCQYMADNFEYEAHIWGSLTPYQSYIQKKVDCDDTAIFAHFIANFHGYKTYLIRIYYFNLWENHCIAIYDFDGCLHFSDNQYYLSTGYTDFKDIVELDTQLCRPTYTWSLYLVYDYDNNLIEKVQK